jgi:hypothetical protein
VTTAIAASRPSGSAQAASLRSIGASAHGSNDTRPAAERGRSSRRHEHSAARWHHGPRWFRARLLPIRAGRRTGADAAGCTAFARSRVSHVLRSHARGRYAPCRARGRCISRAHPSRKPRSGTVGGGDTRIIISMTIIIIITYYYINMLY